MKNEQLYKETIEIWVQAYFNDTLVHGNCAACAIGNIIAARIGIVFWKSKKYPKAISWQDAFPYWDDVFMTSRGSQEIYPENYFGFAKKQIDSTGYTWQDVAKIEFAFETAPKGNSEDEWMFNGLMAAIDALDIIHENTDASVTSANKSKFNKVLPCF